MTQISQFLKKVKDYCDVHLEFDSTNNRYKFKGTYADEINCEYFQNEIENLENSFVDIVESIKNPSVFTKEVIDILVKFTFSYDNEEIYKFNSFHKLNKIMVVTTNNIKTIEKYSLSTILEYPEDLSEHTTLDDIEYYLISHKSLTNNYKDINDFEKIKLEYVLAKFYYSIKGFMTYLFQFEHAMTKYGVEHFNTLRILKRPTPKIIFNSNKLDLATLFDAFFKNGMMRFDLNSNVSNKKALYEFIDRNFAYLGRRNKITPVNNIAKEFGSITKSNHKKRQEEIIDSLIDTLLLIKNNLK